MTGDDRRLLDSELTLICESARGLHEKKELARTPLFSVYWAFAHAHAFLLDKKKMASPNTRSDMHIENGIKVNR